MSGQKHTHHSPLRSVPFRSVPSQYYPQKVRTAHRNIHLINCISWANAVHFCRLRIDEIEWIRIPLLEPMSAHRRLGHLMNQSHTSDRSYICRICGVVLIEHARLMSHNTATCTLFLVFLLLKQIDNLIPRKSMKLRTLHPPDALASNHKGMLFCFAIAIRMSFLVASEIKWYTMHKPNKQKKYRNDSSPWVDAAPGW